MGGYVAGYELLTKWGCSVSEHPCYNFSIMNIKDDLNRKELKKLVKLADMGTVKSVSNEFTNMIGRGKLKAKVSFTVEIDGIRDVQKIIRELNADV